MDLPLSTLLDFELILPPDLRLVAPSAYCRLNLLNYCQFLAVFERARSAPRSDGCAVEEKLDVIRRVIERIVDTESAFSLVDERGT